jgi:hypothetical protein
MFLNAENVIKINQTIDQIHTIFPALSLLGCFFLIESYLPIKTFFESKLDKFLSYTKFYFSCLLTFIALSQGLFGGCVVHTAQNFLSQKYLGRDWNKYGLFYRENIPNKYWPLLRTAYLTGGLYITYRTLKYYEKRIIFKKISVSNFQQKSQNLKVIS